MYAKDCKTTPVTIARILPREIASKKEKHTHTRTKRMIKLFHPDVRFLGIFFSRSRSLFNTCISNTYRGMTDQNDSIICFFISLIFSFSPVHIRLTVDLMYQSFTFDEFFFLLRVLRMKCKRTRKKKENRMHMIKLTRHV